MLSRAGSSDCYPWSLTDRCPSKKIRTLKPGMVLTHLTKTYVNMIEAGIVDPTKVTRSALENAASIASMVLTTESLVSDKKEPQPVAPNPAAGMDGMY